MIAKSLLKAATPDFLRAFYSRWRLQNRYRGLSTQETFSKIYATNAWGGRQGQFVSGIGSDDAWTADYCRFVSEFIRSHQIRTTLDLGCGDFRVGSALTGTVVGADVVPELIHRNRALFPDHQFFCLDMIEDELPAADLCLIRQVFQHLSNDQIMRVLAKLHQFRYVLITEHQWKDAPCPNTDKMPGPHIREKSGVFLEQPPFSQACETVLTVDLSPEEVLRTVLVSPGAKLNST